MWATPQLEFDPDAELSRYQEALLRNKNGFSLRQKAFEEEEPTSPPPFSRLNMLNAEQEDYNRMIGKIEERREIMLTTKAKIVDIDQQVKAAKAKAESLLRSTTGLVGEMENIQADMVQYQADQASRDQIIQKKRSQMEEELRKHSDILGLEVTSTSSSGIVFTFLGLDRQDLSKRFSCELSLDSNRRYLVGNVFPEVAEMDLLVDTLNRSSDISGFVVMLRKRFLGILSC